MTTTLPAPPALPTRISPGVLVAAWTVPVLVLGQFAFVAGVPVAVVLISALRAHRLRWWAAALTAAYFVPLTLWLAGPSSAPSLSKFLSPVATAFLVAAGVTVAVAHHVVRRAGRR